MLVKATAAGCQHSRGSYSSSRAKIKQTGDYKLFQSRQQQHSKSCSHHQITNNSSHPPVTVPVTTKAAATPNSGHSSSHTKLQSQITKMSRTCKKLGASATIQIATVLYQVTNFQFRD